MQASSVGMVMSALCSVLLCVSKAPEDSSSSMTAWMSGVVCVAAKSRGVWPSLLMRFGSAPWARNHCVKGRYLVAELEHNFNFSL
jgi:hypothetical protein